MFHALVFHTFTIFVSNQKIRIRITLEFDNININKYIIFRDIPKIGYTSHPSTSATFAGMSLGSGSS